MLSTDRERNLNMMKSPDDWPVWPYLPLKRKVEGRPPLISFLYYDDEDGPYPILYGCSIYAVQDNDPPLHLCPRTGYDSFEAILDEGWEVD